MAIAAGPTKIGLAELRRSLSLPVLAKHGGQTVEISNNPPLFNTCLLRPAR
jgi:hypothetical protein